MVESEFDAASTAAESWVITVCLVARLGERGSVDAAYKLLLPRAGENESYNLQDSYAKHVDVLNDVKGKLATLSDCPVKWEQGRGWSAIASVPNGVIPHRWPSAHEAAAGIARLALEILVWPLEGIVAPAEQRRVAEQCLRRCSKALVMSLDEVADLQERIRWERAKLLQRAEHDEVERPNVLPVSEPNAIDVIRITKDGLTGRSHRFFEFLVGKSHKTRFRELRDESTVFTKPDITDAGIETGIKGLINDLIDISAPYAVEYSKAKGDKWVRLDDKPRSNSGLD